jgi:hypothetical protein
VSELLKISLSAAVPLWIERLRSVPWDRLEARAREAAQVVAEKGDIIQYRSKKPGETAKAFNALAEGIAILAFVPGGVTFSGLHFRARHDSKPPQRKRQLIGETWMWFVPHVFPALPFDETAWFRAGGDVVCETCEMVYHDHPIEPEMTILHVLCSGARVKL